MRCHRRGQRKHERCRCESSGGVLIWRSIRFQRKCQDTSADSSNNSNDGDGERAEARCGVHSYHDKPLMRFIADIFTWPLRLEYAKTKCPMLCLKVAPSFTLSFSVRGGTTTTPLVSVNERFSPSRAASYVFPARKCPTAFFLGCDASFCSAAVDGSMRSIVTCPRPESTVSE